MCLHGFMTACFPVVLKMLIHAPAGIALLPLYAVNGRNITSVIVRIFFPYACDVECLKSRAVIIF